jgi:hypothetical protein
MLDDGFDVLQKRQLVSAGDIAVVIFGSTLISGATNVMKVHTFQ